MECSIIKKYKRPDEIIFHTKNGTQHIIIVKNNIGNGGYGSIYDGIMINIDATNIHHEVAIKKINFAKNDKNMFEKEIDILSELGKHGNEQILKYYDFACDNDNGYIITEYIKNYITIKEFVDMHVKKHSIPSIILILTIVGKILATLKFIHDNGVMHKDVSSKNVMVDVNTMEIKLIDFGLSCVLIDKHCKLNSHVTLPYSSPEYLKSLLKSHKLADENMLKMHDLYGVGMLFYYMVNMKNPKENIQNESVLTLVHKIIDTELKSEYVNNALPQNLTNDINDIINRMVSNDVTLRMNVDDAIIKIDNLLNDIKNLPIRTIKFIDPIFANRY